ncbi:HRDC domain-containing protein [Paenibacillus alvei]|uniref:HRDC domain-containing protein n=1 Tax=Paenibacillus alvei TaxID=44250 RepID=UPI0013D9E08E|nr:HRDC domain-containing protein [Paenibacillus alvei]MBG9737229.1 preprotein translocase subunit SecA [Paenibacillus alvei]MBG9746323.1 preprotein translocase subunit SecA [Paenibacillus alvei]MCY9581678.1 HRDC domain-containing protein [Paenibacillus alvei]MCY9586195.1 HRDC domain-containing protein [Paenibacillus alvei]NEZ42516.1 hypothetical protein [Paenibacillus alvei]
MQIVWMARLERMKLEGVDKVLDKRDSGDESRQYSTYGLVTAGEDEGKWIVLWEPDGQPSEVWFEGTVWAEMRAAMRRGLARLLHSGYRLAIGFVPEADIHERRMKERNEWIACYADLYARSEVYEQLAKWRRDVASKLRRAPYWIATNRMLRMVSALLPQTLEELKQLPGFGEAKLNAYGEDIIAIAKQFERTTTFPPDWISTVVSQEEFAKWVYSEWESKQNQELSKLTDRRVLLEGLQQQLSIEQLMERLQVDRRELIMRIETVERDGYNVNNLAESELCSMPEEQRAVIEQAFAELGEEYLKPIYVRAFGEEALDGAYTEVQANYERIRLLRLLYRSRVRNSTTQAAS